MRTWRFWAALWAGKAIGFALRIMKKNGTTFPGLVASRFDPEIIRHLGKDYSEGIVIVTGTNGKTTTANLLAGILQSAGRKFAFNRAGANLVTGITGALLQNSSWTGRPRVKLALLEVDEATVPKLCKQVKPSIAIVTNFFRDQLDRYGELDTTVKLVKGSLTAETLLILNADDPLVAQFGLNRSKETYYGIDRTPESRNESGETREARFCPQCGTALSYTLFHYGQLGIFKCENCGFARPKPAVLAENIQVQEGRLNFRVGVNSFSVALQGYYNLYNCLGALTAARELGISDQDIDKGLRGFLPQAGRMETFALSQGRVTLTLVKNPTGFNQVIQAVLGTGKDIHLLIAINDLAADGRDISWLWDVDFERLGQENERIQAVVCAGLRAEDMALRLKYAGIAQEKLCIEHSLEKAVLKIQEKRYLGEEVFVLPTYTALFPLREILASFSKKNKGNEKGERERGEASA